MVAKLTRETFGYTNHHGNHSEKCGNCHFYNMDGDNDCDLYEMLNGKLSRVFDADKDVSEDGWCMGHRPSSKEDKVAKLVSPTKEAA